MSCKNIFWIILLCLFSVNTYATQRYWRGTSANKNWNNTANWSATSGGTTGVSVPASTDSVYFDSGGDSICTINAAVSIKYLNIAGSYTQTISQNANTITIGTSGAVLSGGTFSGGSSNITVSGPFTISGTAFTSTSALLNITGNYNFSSGTFIHNSGEVKFSGTTQSITGSTTFYHLTLTATTLNIASGTVLIVNNLLDLNSSVINTGAIYAKGNIQQSGSSTAGGGTGTITINGTGSQTLNGQTSYTRHIHGWAPSIVVSKSSSDTLFLKDWITVKGNFTDSSGVINSTVYANNLGFPTAGTNTIYGKFTVDSLSMNTSGGGSNTVAVNSGDTLTITHGLVSGGTAAVFLNGIYRLNGDLLMGNTGVSTITGGTGTILINGTSGQTINGTATAGQGRLCSVKINKSSGTLTLKNKISVAGDWIYQAGAIDASTYTSTLFFTSNNSGRTMSGKHSLYNLTFDGTGNNVSNISATDTLTVTNTLTISGSSIVTLNTGVIRPLGDVTVTNSYSTTNTGGTGTIHINGTGSQTLQGTTNILEGRLPNVKIDKPSGTLTLKNYTNVGGDWTYISGTIDASTYSSTVCFPSSSGRTISGKHTLYNVAFHGISGGGSTNTISATDTLTIAGKLRLEGSNLYEINTGVMKITGDVEQNSTYSPSSATMGTATALFTGTGNQTITGAASSGPSRLPNVKISKTGGTLTLKNVVNVSGDWTYVGGTIDMSTFNATVCFAYNTGRTISGKPAFKNLAFYASSTNTSSLSDTVAITGELRYEGSSVITINNGTLDAKGDITITNTVNSAGGGTGYLHICGTGTQNFTGNGVAQTCLLSNIKIDKPSGTLNLSSYISMPATSTWKYIQGTVNPGTSVLTTIGGATIDANPMHFYDLRVQGGTTTTLSSDLYVNNLLYIQAARGLNPNSHTIYVGGNWDNSGTFTIGTGKVVFNGSSSQYIIHPTVNQTFYDIEINKASGKLYCYNSNIAVNHSMILTKGIVVSNSTKMVTFADNNTVSGASDSSYVHGFVKKTGNDAFTFPLGDTVLTTGAYHLLTMTAPSSTNDAFTASYRDSVQYSGDSLQLDSLSAISTCERWLLTRNAGTSTVVPTLGWNSNSCNVDGCHKLRVTGWDGSRWRSLGYNGITTSGSMGTVKAASGYSTTTLPLVIAWPINPSLAPTVTVTPGDTICSGSGMSLTASGAETYSWAPATGLSSTTGATVTASPTTTTTYTVTGTNSIGCTGTAVTTVTVITSPTVSVTPTNPFIGTGGSVGLAASGASTYTWSPTTGLSPTTGASVTASPSATTTYTVTGTATNGCTGTAASIVTVVPICVTENLVSGTVCIQSPVTISVTGDKACSQAVNIDFGDGYNVNDTVDFYNPAIESHTFSAVGNYVLTIKIYDFSSHLLRTDTSHVTLISCAADCDDCIPSFAPIPAKKYELSAWAKQSGASDTVTRYTSPKITVSSSYGSYSVSFTPSGPIIDGWEKIEGEFTLPGLATNINIKLESTSGDTYFDDIRVFPFDGSMKSYVYDPVNMRLVAELDERNYATFYEYDEEGKLVRVKKETERGIMTIKENRNNTSK